MEKIQITKDMIPDFRAFLAQPGISYESIGNFTNTTTDIIVTATEQVFHLEGEAFKEFYKKYDPIIFGKDSTENIVSIEVDDTSVTLYKEIDGAISTEIRPYSPWLLTPRPIGSNSKKLEGKQWYRYITEFSSVEDFQKTKQVLRKKQTDFFTMNDLKEQYMVSSGVTYFKGMQPKGVSVLSFDIETAGISRNKNSEVYLITNTYRNKQQTEKKTFNLFDYNFDMENMILDWCHWVTKKNPSILLGHNIYTYDIPYLTHCLGYDLPLGRNNQDCVIFNYTSKFRKDGSQDYDYNKVRIYGREVVDTMFLSMKHDIAKKYISYGLKSIIAQEGWEKPGRSFVDASKIKEYFYNYKTNPRNLEYKEQWEKVVSYAEEDSDDALKLFDMMIPATFYFNQTVPKSFHNMIETATGVQMNSLMVRAYLQQDMSIAKADNIEKFQGAISIGIPGIYANVLKWDVAGLYPSIIRQFKIFNRHKDPNGYFLYLTEYYAKERLVNKKLAKETGEQYYKDMEQTQKVGANSLYGFLGATGLNYNFLEGASFVTAKGREILEKAILWATGKNAAFWELKSESDDEQIV